MIGLKMIVVGLVAAIVTMQGVPLAIGNHVVLSQTPAPGPESWVMQMSNFTATGIMGIALVLTLLKGIPHMAEQHRLTLEATAKEHREAMGKMADAVAVVAKEHKEAIIKLSDQIKEMLVHCSSRQQGP